MKYFTANRWSLAGTSALATLLAGCTPSQVEPTASVGTLNVQRYVAVGDSYSSGFSDGGLTRTGQENSFPALLAKVFQRVTDAPFTQPLLDAGAGTGYLRFTGFAKLGTLQTTFVPGNAQRVAAIANPNACGGPGEIWLLKRANDTNSLPQNLALPGLQLSQIRTPDYGNEASATPAQVNLTNPYASGYNPYFERLLPAADSRTYLQAVTSASRDATFFTYFGGLDDLLPYVRTGGTCGTFPNQSAFTDSLNSKARRLLNVLAAGGRRGIIAELPTLNVLPILRLGTAVTLQARLQAERHDTKLIYIYNSKVGVAFPAAENDYILPKAIARIGRDTTIMVGTTLTTVPYGRHILAPVANGDAIDYLEYLTLNGIVTLHNNFLRDLALKTYKMPLLSNTPSGALLDITNSVFLQGEKGSTAPIAIGGVQYSTELVRGGIFSLDYYSLTPRGNGLLANAFIDAINLAYKATLPAVDVNNLPTTAQ